MSEGEIKVDAVRRWALVLILLIAFVAFVAYARGRVHHRGPQQVGAIAHITANVPTVHQPGDA